MNQVLSVSYPRSGHHLMVDILCKYFSGDPEFTPSAPHTDGRQWFPAVGKLEGWPGNVWPGLLQAGDFTYCNRYAHKCGMACRDRPNLQKIHGNEDIGRDRRPILLMVRTVDQTIISHFKFERRFLDDNRTHYFLNMHVAPWTQKAFEVYERSERRRILDWRRRWFQKISVRENWMIVRFEDLMADTLGQMTRTVQLLGEKPDQRKLASAISAQQIRAKEPQTITQFKESLP